MRISSPKELIRSRGKRTFVWGSFFQTTGTSFILNLYFFARNSASESNPQRKILVLAKILSLAGPEKHLNPQVKSETRVFKISWDRRVKPLPRYSLKKDWWRTTLAPFSFLVPIITSAFPRNGLNFRISSMGVERSMSQKSLNLPEAANIPVLTA